MGLSDNSRAVLNYQIILLIVVVTDRQTVFKLSLVASCKEHIHRDINAVRCILACFLKYSRDGGDMKRLSIDQHEAHVRLKVS